MLKYVINIVELWIRNIIVTWERKITHRKIMILRKLVNIKSKKHTEYKIY